MVCWPSWFSFWPRASWTKWSFFAGGPLQRWKGCGWCVLRFYGSMERLVLIRFPLVVRSGCWSWLYAFVWLWLLLYWQQSAPSRTTFEFHLYCWSSDDGVQGSLTSGGTMDMSKDNSFRAWAMMACEFRRRRVLIYSSSLIIAICSTLVWLI